ncbi:MAG: ABC transporter permease [Acidimicrobiia bacterium]
MNYDLIVNGVAIGGVASLLAVGITQIFRVTGVLNFAHAGFALVAAYVYAWLYEQGFTLAASAAGAILVATLLGTAAEALVLRRLESASFTSKVIVTLGLYLFLQGLVLQLFGFIPKRAPYLLEGTTEIGGLPVGYQQIAILVVALSSVGGLQLFLQRSRLGLACRACAENREMAGVLGIPRRLVSSVNWTLGAMMAGIAGVLIAPLSLTVNVETFGIYLVTSIAAALFGGLTGLLGAFVGGLVLGIVQSVATVEIGQAGIEAVAVLGAVVLLLALRRRWPSEMTDHHRIDGGGWRGSRAWLPARVVFGGLWLLLAVNAFRTNFWAFTAALVLFYALVSLSLVVSAGWTGQLSLGHGALVGLGTFSMLALQNDHGLAFGVALPITLGLGALAGLLYGAVSLRLGSTQVAIATLAVSLAGSAWLFPRIGTGGTTPVPEFLASDVRLMVGFAVAVGGAGLLLLRIRETFWGRAFLATRDAPAMVRHFDVPVAVCRLWAFSIAGAIAALAGAGFGMLLTAVPSFAVGVTMSLNVLVFTVVGGLGLLAGAVIGPLLFIAGPQVFKTSQVGASAWPQLAGGLVVMLVVLARPDGLGSLLRRPTDRRATAPSAGTGRTTKGGADAVDLDLPKLEAGNGAAARPASVAKH